MSTYPALRPRHSPVPWLGPATAYCGATFMDLMTTALALGLGLHEGNPVAAPFIKTYGLGPQVLVSVVLCAVLCWYASRGGAKLVLGLAIVRWIVVANNLLQLMMANH